MFEIALGFEPHLFPNI